MRTPPSGTPCFLRMSRLSITCPHCGRTTRVDLSSNLTTQKCDRCGIRFSSVDTGLKGSREVQLTEPPKWRRTKTGAWEDGEGEDAPPRQSPAAGRASSRAAWMAVGAVFVLAAATVVAIARHGAGSAPAVRPVDGSGRDGLMTEGGLPLASGYETLRGRIGAATSAAQKYLSVKTVDELLPLIEHRGKFEARVRSYYAEGEGRTRLPMPEFTLAPMDRQIYVDRLKAVVISYETPGQVPRAVALRQEADGRWRVDWPSAVGLNEVALADFRARRETTARLFRVLGSRDDYFNRAFSSDEEWVCLRLGDPAQEHRLYAYARRGTPAAEGLLQAALPRKAGIGTPLMLRLRFPLDAPSDDQVEITEFVGPGWVMEDSGQEPGFETPAQNSTPPASGQTPSLNH